MRERVSRALRESGAAGVTVEGIAPMWFLRYEDPRREAVRFVRDYLSGLRIYRFTTLADGILAAALALHAILVDRPDHPLARERIMLWEDALLSPVMRALMGADGPLARVSASIGNVARQVEMLASL